MVGMLPQVDTPHSSQITGSYVEGREKPTILPGVGLPTVFIFVPSEVGNYAVT